VRIAQIATLLLVGIVLASGFACGVDGGAVTKPSVGNIPQGWHRGIEDSYGTYEELDGTKWGLIEYTDTEDADFIQIFYGDVPSELQGMETDSDALIGRAALESIFEPDETGTMIAAGQIAGYTKAYDPAMALYEMEIVFVVNSTCIDIYTIYDATSEDEAQVMSLINSISL
jgi:hypothetical protein